MARTPTASDVEMSSSGQPAIVVEAVLPVDWFEDVTERSGINFVSRNGREGQRYFLIESFGGGVRHCRDHCRVRRRLLSGVEIQFEQSRRTVTSGRSKCRAQAQRSRAAIEIGDPCGWRQVPRSGTRAVSIAREARKLGHGPHTVRGAHPRNLSEQLLAGDRQISSGRAAIGLGHRVADRSEPPQRDRQSCGAQFVVHALSPSEQRARNAALRS